MYIILGKKISKRLYYGSQKAERILSLPFLTLKVAKVTAFDTINETGYHAEGMGVLKIKNKNDL